MSKWFEITVQASKVVVVEIADDSDVDPEDEARSIARSEAFSFCDEVETPGLLLLETPEQIACAKRSADEVYALPDSDDD